MVLIPAKMGRINKRALVGRLQRIGQASRADLAKSLGLSQPTAGKIADELLRMDVLEEVEEDAAAHRAGDARNRVGRPGRILRLSRRRTRFLAMELGVNETNLAAVPVGAAPEDRWTVQMQTPASADGWVRELKEAAMRLPHKEFWGVLVSVPGIVDELGSRVLFSPNLHWTEAADLPALIQKVWSAPVALVQEERALALGYQCVDSREEDFLLVDFGEGVGGAAIVSGRPFTGALPLSGELGHTRVPGNRRKCGCGAIGCIETLVSVRGLLRSFAQAQRSAPHTWDQLAMTIEAQGIPDWLEETLEQAGVVISGALNVLGLRRVILSGALTELPPVVMENMSQAILRGAMWARFGEVLVETAPRRRTAGLVAVGIDRIVLPMEPGVRSDGHAAAGPFPGRAAAGWLSYDE